MSLLTLICLMSTAKWLSDPPISDIRLYYHKDTTNGTSLQKEWSQKAFRYLKCFFSIKVNTRLMICTCRRGIQQKDILESVRLCTCDEVALTTICSDKPVTTGNTKINRNDYQKHQLKLPFVNLWTFVKVSVICVHQIFVLSALVITIDLCNESFFYLYKRT